MPTPRPYTLKDVAEAYGMSRRAMLYRVHQLGLGRKADASQPTAKRRFTENEFKMLDPKNWKRKGRNKPRNFPNKKNKGLTSEKD